MERLKRLNLLYKYNNLLKVRVISNKSFYKELQCSSYHVESINEDKVKYYVKIKDFNKFIKPFLDESITYTLPTNVLKNAVTKKGLMYLTFILIFFLFVVTPRYIREVEFSNNDTYDAEVLKTVKSELKQIGPFYKLSRNINDISHDLRVSFPHYAFIGLSLYGSKLLIELETISQKTELINNSNDFGNIVARKNAIISSIYVSKGKALVNINQFVKKDDILISGYVGEDNNLVKTGSSGLILGITLEKEVIYVKKQEVIESYTSNIYSKFNIMYKNKPIFKVNDYFNKEYIALKSKFTIFNIFDVVRESHFEKKQITLTFDYASATNKAISLLYYNLDKNKVSNEEKILDYELINSQEEDEFFIFEFLVRKKENIGTFIPF